MLLDLFGLVYNVDALAPAQVAHGHGFIRLERSHQGQPNNGAPTGEWHWRKLTGREVHSRIERSKRDTAPGPDGIPWSAQRHLATE